MGFNNDDKGVFVLFTQDPLESHDLAATDHAQQGRTLCAGLGAAGSEQGNAAIHIPHDAIRDLLPAGGHDKAGFV